ncbi:hypothetical protein SOPP22_17155 [Shewanella sp. OPT22]|nr:hypothetical protein SOPP22_17155 [Shewanella sp. OPT22]
MKQVFKALLIIVIAASFIGSLITQYHLGLIALTCALLTIFFLLPTKYNMKENVIKKARQGVNLWQSPIPYLAAVSTILLILVY